MNGLTFRNLRSNWPSLPDQRSALSQSSPPLQASGMDTLLGQGNGQGQSFGDERLAEMSNRSGAPRAGELPDRGLLNTSEPPKETWQLRIRFPGDLETGDTPEIIYNDSNPIPRPMKIGDLKKVGAGDARVVANLLIIQSACSAGGGRFL